MYKCIIWILYLAIKAQRSDGSSPVTTTPLLNLFSYTTGFISMQAYWFVRIDMPFL